MRKFKEPVVHLVRKLAKKNYHTARWHYQYLLANKERASSELPVLVYQMGKVGSTSVCQALKNTRMARPIYHFHILRPERVRVYEMARKKGFPDIKGSGLEYVWLCQHVRKQIQKKADGRRWKIVTLVRDPVAASISEFFENSQVSVDGKNQEWRIRSEWYGYDTIVNNGNLELLTQLFLEKYDHNLQMKYFDHEFKGVLDVDLYAIDFPTSKGYKIYEEKTYDILLLRLEDLNDCASPAFREFLGIDGLKIPKRNVGEQKAYAGVYRNLKENIILPASYLDMIYSSKLAQHFYSPSEIKRFRDRWSERRYC